MHRIREAKIITMKANAINPGDTYGGKIIVKEEGKRVKSGRTVRRFKVQCKCVSITIQSLQHIERCNARCSECPHKRDEVKPGKVYGKLAKAQELGVTVMGEAEALKLLNIS